MDLEIELEIEIRMDLHIDRHILVLIPSASHEQAGS